MFFFGKRAQPATTLLWMPWVMIIVSCVISGLTPDQGGVPAVKVYTRRTKINQRHSGVENVLVWWITTSSRSPRTDKQDYSTILLNFEHLVHCEKYHAFLLRTKWANVETLIVWYFKTSSRFGRSHLSTVLKEQTRVGIPVCYWIQKIWRLL